MLRGSGSTSGFQGPRNLLLVRVFLGPSKFQLLTVMHMAASLIYHPRSSYCELHNQTADDQNLLSKATR